MDIKYQMILNASKFQKKWIVNNWGKIKYVKNVRKIFCFKTTFVKKYHNCGSKAVYKVMRLKLKTWKILSVKYVEIIIFLFFKKICLIV